MLKLSSARRLCAACAGTIAWALVPDLSRSFILAVALVVVFSVLLEAIYQAGDR